MRPVIALVCLLCSAAAHAADDGKLGFLDRIERVSATAAEAARAYDRAFRRKCGRELTKADLLERLRPRGGDPAFELVLRGGYDWRARMRGEAGIACDFEPGTSG